MRLLPLLVLALFAPAGMLAQTIAERDGNLFYRASESAAPRQLTTSGVDREPRLSPDGQTVAFIRGTPADSVDTVLGREEATQLWTIRVDGSGARMVARGRAGETAGETLALMQGPRFSPDGRRIYVLSAAWATSGAVHGIDVDSGRDRFIAPGNSLDVVPWGEYAGYLLVSQHRNFLAGGSYDWIWLVAPDGREVGPVGEDERAVEEFRAMYVDP